MIFSTLIAPMTGYPEVDNLDSQRQSQLQYCRPSISNDSRGAVASPRGGEI